MFNEGYEEVFWCFFIASEKDVKWNVKWTIKISAIIITVVWHQLYLAWALLEALNVQGGIFNMNTIGFEKVNHICLFIESSNNVMIRFSSLLLPESCSFWSTRCEMTSKQIKSIKGISDISHLIQLNHHSLKK